MKQLLFILILFSSVTGRAQLNDEVRIRELLSAQTTGWNNGSLEDFMKGYWNSDSLIFVEGDGPRYGYQAALANYKKNFPDTTHMGQLSFTLLKLERLSGDYYLVLGKYFLKRSLGNAGGTFSLLVRKIKGHWLIVLDHTSAARPASQKTQ